MKIKRDQVTGIVLIIIGIFLGVLIGRFNKPFTPEYPGPSLLPGIGVFGLVVCGAGIFVNGLRQKKEDEVFVDLKGWIRIAITFAVLCAYVFVMKYLGFIVTTPFVLFFLTTFFSKQSNVLSKVWVRILFSVIVTAMIYGMYVPLFGMTLPTGLLFE